jgi:hypothetical protein
MTSYYVEPDPTAAGGEAYWLEGYAVGDAKFAGMVSAGTSVTDIGGERIHLTGFLSEGTSTTFFGGNRVASRVLVQEASGATLTGASRIRFTGAKSAGVTTTIIIGGKLWEPEPAPVDLFVDVQPSETTSDFWIDVDPAAADAFVSVPAAGDGVSGFVDVPPANDNEANSRCQPRHLGYNN